MRVALLLGAMLEVVCGNLPSVFPIFAYQIGHPNCLSKALAVIDYFFLSMPYIYLQTKMINFCDTKTFSRGYKWCQMLQEHCVTMREIMNKHRRSISHSGIHRNIMIRTHTCIIYMGVDPYNQWSNFFAGDMRP